MTRLCENCKVVMEDESTEDGRCPTCGLSMIRLEQNTAEFDLMLTALLYGRKPQ